MKTKYFKENNYIKKLDSKDTEVQIIMNNEVVISTQDSILDNESISSGTTPVGIYNGKNIVAILTLPLGDILASYQENKINLCSLRLKLKLTNGISNDTSSEYKISYGNKTLYKGCLANKKEFEELHIKI